MAVTSRDLLFLNLGPWSALFGAVVLHTIAQRRHARRTRP